MEYKLIEKCVLPLYYGHLLDKLRHFSRGSQSAKEYVAKFNELLIRCRGLSNEGDIQVLSRFITYLQHDL